MYLFVEDEDYAVDFLISPLKSMNIQVDRASNPKIARRKLQENKYDGVILDLVFSNIDQPTTNPDQGVELLRQIREGKIEGMKTDINVLVYVVSCITDDHVRKEVDELGVKEYIVKPVSFERMIELFGL